MPTINKLPLLGTPSGADQIPVYAPNSGDARRMSITALTDYIEDNLSLPDNAANITYNPAGTGAVATTVQAKLRETVSVKDFGAVGDGVTDDTAAIQAAIAYIAGSGNGGIYFPRGNYKFTAQLTLNSGVSVFGEGVDVTTLRYYGAGGSAINQNGTALSMYVKNTLEGFSLYNNGTGVSGIFLNYCAYSTFANIRVYGFTNGIAISNSWINEFHSVICEANSQDGFNLSTTDANSLLFAGCAGLNNGRAGWYIAGGRSITLQTCSIETNLYGVFLSGGASFRPLGVTLVGCYIEGNTTYEVLSQATSAAFVPAGITLSGCYFCKLPSKATVAVNLVDSTNVVIDGCTFDDQGGNYTYSLYMELPGIKSNVKWGRNYDSSTNSVYSEIYYENENKLQAKAWGNFSVSGGAIGSINAFGISNIARITTGTYEVTLSKAQPSVNFSVSANANAPTSVACLIATAGMPTSTTVFRIYTGTAANTLFEAENVSFQVFS